ncbi:MAG TPA: sulfotransferase [Thermoleophilaceae bacterium]|nr:sulfotransferase [Thermoleophilaceae bacterium]
MSANDDARRLLLVVGVGRSGTSLLTGVLGQLGFHVPQPEVEADDTNPRGFSEPRWAVDFHSKLLKARRVTVNDSRPKALESTATAAEDEATHAELGEWLSGQLETADSVVIKDPRTGWFLPLWTRSSAELGVEARYVTMLRHPAEILASAAKSYGDWQSPASRAAAWVNITLETEHATRGSRRAFVRYEDLLDDWPREIGRMAELLELPTLTGGNLRERFPGVDKFVDPTLHRNRIRWDELDVPERVRDMAEQVWSQLQPLADPAGDTPELHRTLDEARAAFGELYREAESIAQSSITAAKPRRKAKKKAPPPPPSLKVRLARRVPAPARRRLRKALRRH